MKKTQSLKEEEISQTSTTSQNNEDEGFVDAEENLFSDTTELSELIRDDIEGTQGRISNRLEAKKLVHSLFEESNDVNNTAKKYQKFDAIFMDEKKKELINPVIEELTNSLFTAKDDNNQNSVSAGKNVLDNLLKAKNLDIRVIDALSEAAHAHNRQDVQKQLDDKKIELLKADPSWSSWFFGGKQESIGSNPSRVAKWITEAIEHKNIDFLKRLLPSSKVVKDALNTADENGKTPLYYAAECGLRNPYLDNILKIPPSIIDSKSGTNGMTALHMAVAFGDQTTVKALLDKGAKPEITASGEKNTLHFAASNENSATVMEDLIKAYDAVASARTVNNTTRTAAASALIAPLFSTSFSNATQNAALAGVTGAVLGYASSAITQKNERHNFINAKDAQNNTPLHIAAASNNPTAVKCLSKNGASLGEVDKDGKTALHIAAQKNNPQIVTELLQNWGSSKLVNQETHTKDYVVPEDRGKTALQLAAHYGSKDAAQALLQSWNFGHIKYQDHNQQTALHMAATHGNAEITASILKTWEGWWNVNIQDNQGKTALHYAVENYPENYKDLGTIQTLIQNGVNVNLKDKQGKTALGHAIENYIKQPADQKDLGTITQLIKAGARIPDNLDENMRDVINGVKNSSNQTAYNNPLTYINSRIANYFASSASILDYVVGTQQERMPT